MKRIITLIVIGFIGLNANAQYDYNYSFWSNAIHPNNSKADIIKKAGYTNMLAVEYELSADDTAETIKEIKYLRYDKAGRVVFSAPNKSGKGVPYSKYEYDKKGRVKKYIYQEKYYGSQTKYPEEGYEFEYGDKGLTDIKYKGHKAYKWNGKTKELQFVFSKDTVVYTFSKEGMLVKFEFLYRTKKDTRGRKTTNYSYNKNNNIATYSYLLSTLENDSLEMINTTYNYTAKNILANILVKRYNFEDNSKQLNREEVYSYIYNNKGEVIASESSSNHFYWENGEEMSDFFSGSTEYFYNSKGLLFKKMISSDPGFETVELYQYYK